jgi:hypothetical protein
MNKELIKSLNSLKEVLLLGMISTEEYKKRFSVIMNKHNKEYKKVATSIKF